MKNQWLRIAVLGVSILMWSNRSAPAQTAAPEVVAAPEKEPPATEAPAVAQDTFETMMGAIEDNNRAAFVALGEAPFKAAMTPPVFQALVDQLGGRLKAGHEFRYLGAVNKAGYVVSVWRVRFSDGGDDLLGEVSEKSAKVGGFFLR